ncbi:hypothetical protein M569_13273, partial [Genlisea aurea]
MAFTLRRLAFCKSLISLPRRCLSTTDGILQATSQSTVPETEAVLPVPPPPPRARTRTPSEKQFEKWIEILKPGFSPFEVEEALRSQQDPDLALDIFRWTAQQRHYRHNSLTYFAIIEIAVSGKRYRAAENLIEEVIAGACPPSVPLFNAMIKFCCRRRSLFNRAFDVYRKMLRSHDSKPNLETYSLLLSSLLRKFDKSSVCHVYMPSVRSLSKQMKACGVIPNTLVLNMIIKAFSKCHEVEESIRTFHEMGLYGCEPNAYTYSYLTKGMCEKGRANQGLSFYRQMRGRGLIPQGRSTCSVLICSLAMEGSFEDAVEVADDMVENAMAPDLLTYETLLEEMCRHGREEAAFEVLERFRKMDRFMTERTYN